jgi:putative glutamine amidotransferase
MTETTSPTAAPNATNRPLIGVVLDWHEKMSFAPRPHYAIRDSYFKTIYELGGLPVGIPLIHEGLEEFIHCVDAVVTPGGDYPSPSRWYGDDRGIQDEHPRTIVNEDIVKIILQTKKPFLGICAGMQELVVATGGLLYWRVKESLPNALNHRSIEPGKTSHTVSLVEGTQFAELAGKSSFEVNSHHSEGVKVLSGGLIASAYAPDGLIEAVEMPDHPFCIGVQWHPELLLDEADKALFTGLIEAARNA